MSLFSGSCLDRRQFVLDFRHGFLSLHIRNFLLRVDVVPPPVLKLRLPLLSLALFRLQLVLQLAVALCQVLDMNLELCILILTEPESFQGNFGRKRVAWKPASALLRRR